MGQGQIMPVWYTMDQSLKSSAWEGAIKAGIWPLGAELQNSSGTAQRLGHKQGNLGSTNWLRLLKYKFPGFHGRVQIHMYSALFWS